MAFMKRASLLTLFACALIGPLPPQRVVARGISRSAVIKLDQTTRDKLAAVGLMLQQNNIRPPQKFAALLNLITNFPHASVPLALFNSGLAEAHQILAAANDRQKVNYDYWLKTLAKSRPLKPHATRTQSKQVLGRSVVHSINIAAGAVTASKIATGAVRTGKLAAGAVTAGKLATGAVTADKIADGAITASTLGSDATDASVANTLIKRDSSKNFAANIIVANTFTGTAGAAIYAHRLTGGGGGTDYTSTAGAAIMIGNLNRSQFTSPDSTSLGIGTDALKTITSGVANNTFGQAALINLTTGSSNNAFGYDTLVSTTSGSYNNAMGNGALTYNIYGNRNVAMGQNAVHYNASGASNVGIGGSALYTNLVGNYNVAVGDSSLCNILDGSRNVAVGTTAGANLQGNASYNICIGNTGSSGDNRMIRLGTAATHTGCSIAGIYGTTVNMFTATDVLIDQSGQLGTTTSSRRYKDNIKDIGSDSAAIASLRPVSFTYKADTSNTSQYGLIAEEVATVMPNLVIHNQDAQPETVRYNLLPILLLNEYQKQQLQLSNHDGRLRMVEEKATTLEDLASRLTALESAFAQFQSLIS